MRTTSKTQDTQKFIKELIAKEQKKRLLLTPHSLALKILLPWLLMNHIFAKLRHNEEKMTFKPHTYLNDTSGKNYAEDPETT